MLTEASFATSELTLGEFLSMRRVLHIAPTSLLSATHLHAESLAVLSTYFQALTRDWQVTISFMFGASAAGHFNFSIHHLTLIIQSFFVRSGRHVI